MKKIVFLVILLLPVIAQAADARLFLCSGAGAYLSGREIKTRVVVSSGGRPGINAAETILTYDPKKIKVRKIAKENSIFGLWPTEPKFDPVKGIIKFAGGTTTPYMDSAGSIFSIYFTPLVNGNVDIDMSSTTSSILTADGRANNILRDADGLGIIVGNSSVVANAESLRRKMSGRILLQVEKDGRSWYVYPSDNRRYFLGRPLDAFNLMRKLGLGTTHKYITSHIDGLFPKLVSGKILLDVEDSGKAYYINPVDMKAYYLGRPKDAFAIMRQLGLGINNKEIKKIPDWAI